jgi:TolB protein
MRIGMWRLVTTASFGGVLAMTMTLAQQSQVEKTPLEASPIGIFEGHRDIGNVLTQYAGNVEYDKAKGTYTVSASGENMWFDHDAFHFAWKRASGNVAVTADISFLGSGKNLHRKAVVIVRQNLEADSPYADVALHGVGLMSLQFRDEKGSTTHEVQANVNAPKRVRIEKHGDYFTMWLAGPDGKFSLAGATPKIVLKSPFYVGIGVCSHEKDVVEKAVFSNVELKEKGDSRTSISDQESNEDAEAQPGNARGKSYSIMEVVGTESTDRRAIYVAEGRFEAPNWMPDGKHLLFNRKGRIETIPIRMERPIDLVEVETVLHTGQAIQCNNDHGISPDGKELAISDQSRDVQHRSQVYVLPITGGSPRLITPNSPSYWHGWSPDGKTLAFVGERNGNFDIYAISDAGGDEKRLTTAEGLDDGPEYSPDGKYIYFNSVRTGHMQIWRMKTDGSEQEQVTHDDWNNWFPHISPDGKWMVILSYDPKVQGHPENQDVMLRLMSMADGKITVVAKLFGGQGTINVPSWSPDSKRFAFVSYAIVNSETAK